MNDMLTLIFLYAAILSFIVIITKSRRTNIPFKIEYLLEDQGRTVLAKPIRTVSRLRTTADEKEKQMKSIHAWIENQERLLGVLQRELYLLEKDALEELKAHAGGLSSNEEASSLETVKENLTRITPSIECGCCIRWRESCHLEDCQKRKTQPAKDSDLLD